MWVYGKLLVAFDLVVQVFIMRVSCFPGATYDDPCASLRAQWQLPAQSLPTGQFMQAVYVLIVAPCCTLQESCTVQCCAGSLPAGTCQHVSRASASGQSILVLRRTDSPSDFPWCCQTHRARCNRQQTTAALDCLLRRSISSLNHFDQWDS